jgi:thiamine-monophosphate kinase
MSEFTIIRDYFDWQPRPADLTLGIGDDAALLTIPQGMELVVSVDTSNAGIHFPLDTPPHAIAYKSLAVNLSDLAAMGAIPKWFTLAISLPDANPVWLSEFARGLRELAEQHQIYLIGGDTTRGALSITIQVMGLVEQGTALLRSRAQIGDLICVSGTLGDAAAGLAVVQQRLNLAEADAAYTIQRLNYPSPRVALGRLLRPYAHACMDISDGLLGDLQHILNASNVGAAIQTSALPLHPALHTLTTEQQQGLALSGGDDYELLFTMPATHLKTIQKQAFDLGLSITVIGKIQNNPPIIQMDSNFHDQRHGYDHFSLL